MSAMRDYFMMAAPDEGSGGGAAPDAGAGGGSGDGKGIFEGVQKADASPSPDASKAPDASDGKVEKKDGEDGKNAAVPEKYEFKMPEGVALDSEVAEEFSPIAKELGLSQEQAQRVADLGAKMAQKAAASQMEAFQKTRQEWQTATKNDKEFGGVKFEENREYAVRAIREFGDPDLAVLLDSGWGDNPALFRFVAKIGRAMGEDKSVKGSAVSSSNKSAAEILYGKQQ